MNDLVSKKCINCGGNLILNSTVYKCTYCDSEFNLKESNINNNNFIIDNGNLIKYTGSEKKVIIPNNVEEINKNVFALQKIEEVVFSNSVTKIGDEAFYACKNLKKIFIPKTIKSIGNKAFCNCTNLKDIIFDEQFEGFIGQMSFSFTAIEEVKIPEKLIDIYDYFCFNDCLKTVTFHENVKTIKFNAFKSCSSLKEILFPESIKEIENDAFNNCTSLKKIYVLNPKIKIAKKAFSLCKPQIIYIKK